MTSHRVLAIIYDGVVSLNATGPLEVFATAGSLAGRPDAYGITTASLGAKPVRSSIGLTLAPDADLDACEPPHTLLVPGGPVTDEPDARIVRRIRELGEGAERVVSVCTGAFLLGAAGLLDGRQATTHWAYCDTLARCFPLASVTSEPLFVQDGKVFSAAGVTAGIDLAMALVEEDLGSEAALAVARALVVFLRRPDGQRQFSVQGAPKRAERHPIRRLQEWIADHPGEDLTVQALAQRAALSPRQFVRVFQDEVGMTPGRFVDRVRLDTARRMLEQTPDGLEKIARAAGFGTVETMRRAFVRQLSVSPGEYRRRFHTAAADRTHA